MLLRIRYYSLLLRITAYSLPVWSFIASFYVRFYAGIFSDEPNARAADYGYLLVFTLVVWALFADHFDVSNIEDLFWERTGVRKTVYTCVATSAVQLIVLFFVRSISFSRVFVALNVVCLLILTLLMRLVFRRAAGYTMGIGKPVRILMVGTDGFARRTALRIRSTGMAACEIVGYIQLPGQAVSVTDSPIYRLNELDVIDASCIDDIVIALPLSTLASFRPALHRLQRLCKPIRAIIDLGSGVFIRQKMFRFGKLQIMDVVTSPAESLQYSVLKRSFDIIFSSCALLLTSPLMAVIAILVKISSPGPVLFTQQRVGLNGELFDMLKFRTMRMAEKTEGDTRWTTEADPRRTVIGTFLRKTSLDELPQFINVLKGEMSVVGPRPERPYFVKKFLSNMKDYNERHRLKVGITGWAQVNGWRGDTSIKKRIEYDLYYMQNWSFSFDLRIIVLTIWSGLINKNAY